MEATGNFVVESPDVVYGPDTIEAQYEYRTACVSREGSVLKVGNGPGLEGGSWGNLGAGRGRELPNVEDFAPTVREEGPVTADSLHCPPLGIPHVHALHLSDRSAGAPAWGHARRLGREQRLHAHRRGAGQPTAPLLAHAHRPQGGGSGGARRESLQEEEGPLGGRASSACVLSWVCVCVGGSPKGEWLLP